MVLEYIALMYSINQGLPSNIPWVESPLPSKPESSSGVFVLPESPEELNELGISEELSPFSDTHFLGNG